MNRIKKFANAALKNGRKTFDRMTRDSDKTEQAKNKLNTVPFNWLRADVHFLLDNKMHTPYNEKHLILNDSLVTENSTNLKSK